MLETVLSLCLLSGTWLTLRGGFIGPGRGLQVIGYDTSALGLGALAVAAAMYFYGWQFGIALIITVAIHEFGHVAAFRVCGHTDARFRLIPLFGGVAISNQTPSRQDKDFFISLMGPAICLAPMMVFFAVSDVIVEQSWQAANFLYILGLTMGALNFFNLLPFWPLDGGKITRILTYTYIPWATRPVTIAMSAAAAALAVLTQSYFLLIFVLMGWQSAIQSERLIEAQRPMTKQHGALALAAYVFTTVAFLMGGYPILQGFF